MREILFRGQTRKFGEKVKMNGEKLPGKWVYGGITQGVGDFSIIYGAEDAGYITAATIEKHVVYTDTIGQFTGLTDKNGKKIFEGDILAIKFFPAYVERICWQGPPDAIAKVYWDYSGFGLNATNGKDRRYPRLCEANLKETEVIGNIHDNPELIGGAVE